MNNEMITSRDNPRVKHARAVLEGKATGEIFIEGLRLSEEAAHAGLHIRDVFHTTEVASGERGLGLLAGLKASGTRLTLVSEQVFATVSDTKTPQGIALIASRPPTGESVLARGSQTRAALLVILHRINNPVNAGAVLRTAEAAGATGIISTRGSTDLFSPKALRGAMGSSFRLPVWAGPELSEALDWCRGRGIRTVSADIRAERAHTDFDWTTGRALIVGAEATGLDEGELALTDDALRIPMQPPVESLNVAVAAAIILYEAARQRAVGLNSWQ